MRRAPLSSGHRSGTAPLCLDLVFLPVFTPLAYRTRGRIGITITPRAPHPSVGATIPRRITLKKNP